MNQTLLLKPLERCIDGTEGHTSPGLPRDPQRNRHAIGALAKPNHREHDRQLKFSEIIVSRHFFDHNEEIHRTSTGPSSERALRTNSGAPPSPVSHTSPPFRGALDAARPRWNEIERRLTRTNITKFEAGSPLLPSGLLGSAKVEADTAVRMAKAD